MTSRVEIDLPEGDAALPFSKLAGFVEHARMAGATADTPVVAVGAPQEPSILISLRVEMDGLAVRGADLRIDRDDVKELLDVLAEIDENEGDARAQLHTLRELRQKFTSIALES